MGWLRYLKVCQASTQASDSVFHDLIRLRLISLLSTETGAPPRESWPILYCQHSRWVMAQSAALYVPLHGWVLQSLITLFLDCSDDN